jgi:preprotein translocase SecE subunit
MAVAVKTSPGARSSGTMASPAIISLIGVLYLLGCLGIVFHLLPKLWWPTWVSLFGLDLAGVERYRFVGGTILVLVALVVSVGLLLLGGKLLGPNPPVGIRSGVFVAFLGLLVVVLLARWASLWLEHWAYDSRLLSPGTAAVIAGVIALLLLAGWIRLFTRPSTQKWVVRLEEGGWFSATSYKANQGLKVRRGTVFGILLLVGAGIYTLISHGTLRKGAPDLSVFIPFTGKTVLESDGDVGGFIKDKVPAAASQVEIRLPGKSNLKPKEIVSFTTYRKDVEEVLSSRPGLVADLEKSKDDPVAYLRKLNEAIHDQMEKLLSLHVFKPDVEARLKEKDRQTDWIDLSELIDLWKSAAGANKKTEELGPPFDVPTALLVVDRYTMRDVNDTRDYVKVGDPGDSEVLKEGQIVSRADFDAEVAALKAKGRGRKPPEEVPLTPATGKVQFQSITILPSVQFTVPLLLLALSLWLAWRIVNMPTFADFLIATEAELNKVSWTTQKRLVQDTIVVLITVVLLAIFLFGMDLMWKEVLKPIGVLVIPEQSKQGKIDQKKW